MVNPGHNSGLLKACFLCVSFKTPTKLKGARGIRDLLSFAKNICGSNLMIKSRQCPWHLDVTKLSPTWDSDTCSTYMLAISIPNAWPRKMADSELLTVHLQHAFPWARIEKKNTGKRSQHPFFQIKKRPEHERMSEKRNQFKRTCHLSTIEFHEMC